MRVPRSEFDVMMDEIAAARGTAELERLRAAIGVRFAAHPRRADLEGMVDAMLDVTARQPAEEEPDL